MPQVINTQAPPFRVVSVLWRYAEGDPNQNPADGSMLTAAQTNAALARIARAEANNPRRIPGTYCKVSLVLTVRDSSTRQEFEVNGRWDVTPTENWDLREHFIAVARWAKKQPKAVQESPFYTLAVAIAERGLED